MWRWFIVAVVAILCWPALAFEPHETGIVLMHGKWGRSNDQSLASLGEGLTQAGFVVLQPEMPWSGARAYDSPLDAAMKEIDAALDELRSRNLKRLVVMGHSQGGSAALLHATTGKRVDAYVLIAPAPAVEAVPFQQRLAGEIARARQLVADGRNERAPFFDSNSDDRGRTIPIAPANYLSYVAADGPGNLSRNAQNAGRAPILWVGGTLDINTTLFGRYAWPRFPAGTPKTRAEVVAHHIDAPAASTQQILAWLRKL
jgi:pimeloyl-ACP methyl ester carboxylesterase